MSHRIRGLRVRFQTVQRAATEYKTLHITNYAFELAKAFNDFYANSPVLQADDAVRNFRLRLVAAAKVALANSLRLRKAKI